MLITLDIKNESMKDSFLNFVKTLDYVEIKEEQYSPKEINDSSKNKFSEFAGMWENQDKNLETIRDKAWKR